MGELSEWFQKKIEEIETSVDEQVSDSQTSGGDVLIINSCDNFLILVFLAFVIPNSEFG